MQASGGHSVGLERHVDAVVCQQEVGCLAFELGSAGLDQRNDGSTRRLNGATDDGLLLVGELADPALELGELGLTANQLGLHRFEFVERAGR